MAGWVACFYPLFLYHKKLLSSPVFYLSSYLEAHRDEYYDRLNRISKRKDWDGWVHFFLRAVIEQATGNTEKVLAILGLYEKSKQQIVDCTASKYSSYTLDTLFEHPIFLSADFPKIAGIPNATAKRILRTLEENGMLERVQAGQDRRQYVYLLPALLRIVDTE